MPTAFSGPVRQGPPGPKALATGKKQNKNTSKSKTTPSEPTAELSQPDAPAEVEEELQTTEPTPATVDLTLPTPPPPIRTAGPTPRPPLSQPKQTAKAPSTAADKRQPKARLAAATAKGQTAGTAKVVTTRKTSTKAPATAFKPKPPATAAAKPPPTSSRYGIGKYAASPSTSHAPSVSPVIEGMASAATPSEPAVQNEDAVVPNQVIASIPEEDPDSADIPEGETADIVPPLAADSAEANPWMQIPVQPTPQTARTAVSSKLSVPISLPGSAGQTKMDENRIHVFLRAKPCIGPSSLAVDVDTGKVGLIQPNTQLVSEWFSPDCFLPGQSLNVDVYSVVQNVVLAPFHGINSAILMYGQTGSGKTHTMGLLPQTAFSDNDPGILPRVLQDYERALASIQSQGNRCTVMVCVEQLYMTQLTTLLDPTPFEDAASCLLKIMASAGNRQVAATNLNSSSSRSHLFITIDVKLEDAIDGITRGSLTLVDLAGSERQKEAGTSGLTLKEAGAINKGIATLGRVIEALATNELLKSSNSRRKPMIVPYHDDKLTHLLKPYLGGASLTAILVCVSQEPAFATQTLASLMFALKARLIHHPVKVNHETTLENEVNRLQQLLAQVTGERDTLLGELQARERLLEEYYSMLSREGSVDGEPRMTQVVEPQEWDESPAGEPLPDGDLRTPKDQLPDEDAPYDELQHAQARMRGDPADEDDDESETPSDLEVPPGQDTLDSAYDRHGSAHHLAQQNFKDLNDAAVQASAASADLRMHIKPPADLQLPVGSGLKAVQQLRSIPAEMRDEGTQTNLGPATADPGGCRCQ